MAMSKVPNESVRRTVPPNRPIAVGVKIGHVHLKVANIERALGFYCGVLGFELMVREDQAAFISAGGYHPHIGLNTGESEVFYRRHRTLSSGGLVSYTC